MAKPDPALLDPARYPFHCAMALRFGDLDVNMHLNNVALLGIIEDARVRFQHASGFHRAGMRAMLANLTVAYVGQAFYPQPLDVHAAVARTGRTSCVLQHLVRQDDRAIAVTESVLVCVMDDRPAPLSATFVDGIANWMLRP